MARRVVPANPPALPGLEHVRRAMVQARGVRFHVTEAGDPGGAPVLLLHGWPQHHLLWRDLLANPPAGLRLIAPDLPGYGWSGPPPHRWEKEEVASDLLALLDELGIDEHTKVGLVGHDWGGWIGHLLCLREPDRFSSFLALNIAHPWNTWRGTWHALRILAYQPIMAAFGERIHHRPWIIGFLIGRGMHDRRALTDADYALYADRLADPVCAKAGRDTYRTFLLREIPRSVRHPEQRRSRVPSRVVFGLRDPAVAVQLASPTTAIADDYRLEQVPDCGHFIVDERPDLVAARVRELFATPVAARAA